MARIIQVSPDLIGHDARFAETTNPDGFRSVDIIAWALLDDGTMTGLVFARGGTPEISEGNTIVPAHSLPGFQAYRRSQHTYHVKQQ